MTPIRGSPISLDRCCTDFYDTEFVNAQYRFVMRPSGDYTVHFADPDMYVITIYNLASMFLLSLAIHSQLFSNPDYISYLYHILYP